LGKKRNKNKGSKNNNRKSNNPHYFYYQKDVTPQQIHAVAYSVFGSLYYNPSDN
jgi:hypothetical protein